MIGTIGHWTIIPLEWTLSISRMMRFFTDFFEPDSCIGNSLGISHDVMQCQFECNSCVQYYLILLCAMTMQCSNVA